MKISATSTVFVEATGEQGGYPVRIARGALQDLPDLLREHAPAHRYAIIADETVADLHGRRLGRAVGGAGLHVDLFTFPAGEENKVRREWARLTDALLEEEFGRDAAVVAVGGGVTGDLAGFVAATFMRGIPVVQVPTSLVAMIDASVGGKTGVDAPAGKNLVGAFHPPRLVVADPEVVRTLPRSERSQGLAEAVKHGAILDARYLQELETRAPDLLDAEPESLLDAVRRSVELKSEVVSEDEREAGLRKILNFGHTLAHAFEGASAYRIPHGSAVALGMVLEARLGERLGVTESGTAAALAGILRRFELPTEVPGDLDLEHVLRLTRMDKKGRSGTPRYVLLRGPGEVARGEGWSHTVPLDAVKAVLGEAGVGTC